MNMTDGVPGAQQLLVSCMGARVCTHVRRSIRITAIINMDTGEITGAVGTCICD